MRRLALFFPFLLGGMALCMSGGCSDPLNRQEVTGQVTLKGQPLDEGVINFAPVDSQSTGDGAQITNGKYRIPRDKGLSPGKYKVTIYAGDGRSGVGTASPDAPAEKAKAGRERVPAEYNRNSTVVKEVKSGERNNFDFDIP